MRREKVGRLPPAEETSMQADIKRRMSQMGPSLLCAWKAAARANVSMVRMVFIDHTVVREGRGSIVVFNHHPFFFFVIIRNS